MAQVGLYQGVTTAAINFGDQSFSLTATPANLKPGMGIVIDNEYSQVANTYTGGTLIPIDGSFANPHLSGAFVQWDGNKEPGLTGS
jgi:hypothetical protein